MAPLQVATKMWPLVILVCLCLLLLFTFSSPPSMGEVSQLFSEAGISVEEDDTKPEAGGNPLDGCHHVYLDMGTNMWVGTHQPPW